MLCSLSANRNYIAETKVFKAKSILLLLFLEWLRTKVRLKLKTSEITHLEIIFSEVYT